MKEKKNFLSTFIVIALIISGYLGLKVFQKYSFNKEYECTYNGIVTKQKQGSRGFYDLYLSNKSVVYLAFYDGWEREGSLVGDSLSKDKNSREIRVYKKDKSAQYQYYKSMDMISD
ncbi:uncharacterized protein CHSO_0459 [Chryseobacterium sp. StRB126]|uniref:hypothetical protein n=1 Tax=Chryseobacterium sp. StRB126 TaxID=878220 RepID=UPI0004E99673|nr:hypothetical protein [Chryseobacterium sp. StRB126]BAP29496.1 uncharacterized protein CHSO_0459 [Chryseobacterium sp. StRB126]